MTVVAKVTSGEIPQEVLQSSGTIAHTVIDTIKVIEHAVRRAGSSASTLTPEQLESAYDNLYLILASMINRGINLWCLEQVLVPFYENQATYQMPQGTVSIVEARNRTVTPLTYVMTSLASVKSIVLSGPEVVRTVGMFMTSAGNYKFAFEYKTSAGVWQAVKNYNIATMAGQWIWFDIEKPVAAAEFRVRETGGMAFYAREYMFGSNIKEQSMYPYNRDDYVQISNKNIAGRPLNYLYEKQITPIMTVWPVPNNHRDVMVVTRQRQVQDVGSLLSKLDIPERWFECIIWMLAKNMAYELPNMTTERITLCTSQAAEALREAELGESDGAPLRILPNISGYTA